MLLTFHMLKKCLVNSRMLCLHKDARHVDYLYQIEQGVLFFLSKKWIVGLLRSQFFLP